MIRGHRGFVDKYIGDAVMAIFPEAVDDAVQAAIELGSEIKIYNSHRANQGYKPIEVGIGLHTGSLMLGMVGSEERLEGTVISDAVNLASRLDGLTKVYGASIMMTSQTAEGLHGEYAMRFLGRIRVKGKTDITAVFEVLSETEQSKMESKKEFEAGLDCYFDKQFGEAIGFFDRVVRTDPKDLAAAHYRERAADYMVRGVPEDWIDA